MSSKKIKSDKNSKKAEKTKPSTSLTKKEKKYHVKKDPSSWVDGWNGSQ